MLQRDWTPIETNGQEVGCIRRQQRASNYGCTQAGDPLEQPEEQPYAGYPRQKHRQAQNCQACAKNAHERTVKPAFDRADIAHKHQRDTGMADADGVSFAVGLQKRPGKESFIVFNADLGKEEQAGEQKKETSNRRRKSVEQGMEPRLGFAG